MGRITGRGDTATAAVSGTETVSSPDREVCGEAPTRPEGERFISLDGLRGLLALFVVIAHCSVFLPAQGEGMTLLAHGFRLPAFFALSGFVLYLSSADRKRPEMKTPFGVYVRRRLMRLYPPYILAMLLFYLVIGTAIAVGLAKPGALPPRSEESLLVHLFYLQSWHPDFDVKFGMIAPVWMLGYELQLALLLPVFLAIVRHIGWAGLLFLGFCLCTPEAQRWNQDPNQQYLFYPSFTLSFLMGLAAARLTKVASVENASRLCQAVMDRRSVVALGVAVGVLLLHLLLFKAGIKVWSEVCAGVAVAAFCLFVSTQPRSWVARILSWRPLLFFGTISYSLFLVHHPLIRFSQMFLGHWGSTSEGNYAALAVLLPIIVITAVVFYHVCERPWSASQRHPRSEKPTRRAIAARLVSLPR